MSPLIILGVVIILYLISVAVFVGVETKWKFKDISAAYAFSFGLSVSESDESDEISAVVADALAAAAEAQASADDAAEALALALDAVAAAEAAAEAASVSESDESDESDELSTALADALAAAAMAQASADKAKKRADKVKESAKKAKESAKKGDRKAAKKAALAALAADGSETETKPELEPEPVAYSPINVDTYRLYKDTAFDIIKKSSNYEKNTMSRNDDESAETFANRCADACSHVSIDDTQCRVFSISNDGDKCTRYQVSTKPGSMSGSFQSVSKPGTQTYRHVGSTNDKICADYIARTEGDDSWFFRKSYHTPKTHYKWACTKSSNPPTTCADAPEVCFK